jgi:hypothetical protein
VRGLRSQSGRYIDGGDMVDGNTAGSILHGAIAVPMNVVSYLEHRPEKSSSAIGPRRGASK